VTSTVKGYFFSSKLRNQAPHSLHEFKHHRCIPSFARSVRKIIS
jgi:hypothetical protein